MSYATRQELTAYAPTITGTDDVLDALLLDASRDIDRFLGWGRSTNGVAPLMVALEDLDAFRAEGLTQSTLAQAVFRDHVGPDYFLDLPETVTQGPDFTITTGSGGGGSAASYIGSLAKSELLRYGLLRSTGRSRT